MYFLDNVKIPLHWRGAPLGRGGKFITVWMLFIHLKAPFKHDYLFKIESFSKSLLNVPPWHSVPPFHRRGINHFLISLRNLLHNKNGLIHIPKKVLV